MIQRRHRALGRIGLLGLVALCSSCGQDCSVVGAACPTTYAVSLDGLPADVGGFALSLSTMESAKFSLLWGRISPVQMDGAGERRAIVIGSPSPGPVAEVRFEVRPANAPTVTLLDVARNQFGAYAAIATSGIRVRVEEIPGEE